VGLHILSFDLTNLSRLPFPTWKPDTCECIARIDTKQLIARCRTHNTYAEMKAHNKSFSTVRSPTRAQEETIKGTRSTEKAKNEFQRR